MTSKIFNYVISEPPSIAMIDLTQVVGVKPNGSQDRLIVQFNNGRGLLLPFNAAARDALIEAWSDTCAVFAYKFCDPDRDDAMTTFAWARIDKVLAVAQHHLDAAFLQIRTTARRSMIVPFNPGAFSELSHAIGAVTA